MPERRKYSELGPGAKARALARRKLNLYVYYGKVKRQPCEVCGAQPAEAHHEDYSKPLDVEWLCPTHHRERDVMRIKPSEIKQAQRFSTGIERVDDSLRERYREMGRDQTNHELAANMLAEVDAAFDRALADGPAPPIIDRSRLRAVIALNTEIAELQVADAGGRR